jgi:phosphatidylinositol alpha-1,6-mannosyltransferase
MDGGREFDREHEWPVIRASAPRGGPKADIAAMNAVAAVQLRRFRPDVVLAGHLIAAPPAWPVRVPLVVYLHADEIPAHPRLSRVSLRRASYAIAVSRHTAALAIRHGADPARIRLIPPGVDLAGAAARRTSDRPTIVTVARLEDRYKGHDVVMRSLALVRRRIPDVRWVIVGDGSLRDELERLAERLRVRDAVVFAGAVDNAERDEWLGRSDVFAMPSRLPPSGGGEGFGIVFLEAGLRGLPVVAANVGGSVDAVENGRTGVLVDPEDERAIATALTELLLDAPRARAMGSAGAERASAYGWDRAAERVETLLLAAAGRLPLAELAP